MKEVIIDPQYTEVIPIFDPILPENLERVDFAFTKKQRDWWLRVYTNSRGIPQCGFYQYSERKGFIRCQNINDIEIHHIEPSGWIKEQFGSDPNNLFASNGRPNGIALCRNHHHVIHPDIGQAFINYGQDKDGIKKAIDNHRELAKSGIIFWDSAYDEMLFKIAEHKVKKYLESHPTDIYPEDKKWENNAHKFIRKSWMDQIL